MEDQKLLEYVDQQRWLLNNGLLSDSIKNQLFFCGTIVHKDVQAVELKLTPEKRLISYVIYVEKPLLKKIDLYNKLSTSTSLFGMWRFKRFLKKEGSLDFQQLLSKFVKDFCGPTWATEVVVFDFAEYVDSLGDDGGSPEGSQQPNKLPD
jgi:hypothetical protein